MKTDNQNNQKIAEHYGSYPQGYCPILLRFGFRPFFILLPIYLILSIVLWGLQWGGFLNIGFTSNIIHWHIYEMVYGLGTAGMAGFLLTAIPAILKSTPTIGKPLLGLVVLWILGRISFWLIDFVGVPIVATINIASPILLLFIITPAIIKDPLKKHFGFIYAVATLTIIQVWFFLSELKLLEFESMAILKLSISAFMLLILVVVRRVSTAITNIMFENNNIDEVFIAKPPFYNLAIFTIIVFAVVEFTLPNNEILAWLGFAVFAALLNITNDFLIKDTKVIFQPFVLSFVTILVFISLGYGLMGLDYLLDDFYAINHFRHFLTTGALGLAYLIVLSIVAMEHTGREIKTSRELKVAIILIIVATLMRVSIAIFPEYTQQLYMFSAIIWASAFLVYLIKFAPFLVKERADGLKG